MGWAQLHATEDTPSSSWGHTTTWLGSSSLLLFGGELLTPGPLGSLRADDAAGGARLLRMELTASAEQRWARVPSAEAPEPPPRRQHAAAVWEGQLVVAGGLGGGGTGVGDLWSMVPTADGRARWATSGLEAAWSQTLARHGHALVPTPSGLLLFGGRMAPVRPGGAEDGAELKVLDHMTCCSFQAAHDACPKCVSCNPRCTAWSPMDPRCSMTCGCCGPWQPPRPSRPPSSRPRAARGRGGA